ncbi:unnamed protein product [Echinostoma caproni]|uniref:NOC3p domain-containing protein n=1 Tax=Echinostoma caproni TaxID=27848 RepID=A0A183AUW6_9TREM|nr:unnamed protein product [Echinostoma caproni]
MERIFKAIGRSSAVPLPFSPSFPPKILDAEQTEQLEKRAEKVRLRQMHSDEMRAAHQAIEEVKLIQKEQDDWNNWLTLVKTQEYQCAQARALPMRHYLMKYVMPELTKALLDCSTLRPDDPIDFISIRVLAALLLCSQSLLDLPKTHGCRQGVVSRSG